MFCLPKGIAPLGNVPERGVVRKRGKQPMPNYMGLDLAWFCVAITTLLIDHSAHNIDVGCGGQISWQGRSLHYFCKGDIHNKLRNGETNIEG